MNRRAKVSLKQMELPKNESRFLKVHTRYKMNGRAFVQVPEIVLKGDWLKDFGFVCGELVKLVPDGQNLRIIRTLPEPERVCRVS